MACALYKSIPLKLLKNGSKKGDQDRFIIQLERTSG